MGVDKGVFFFGGGGRVASTGREGLIPRWLPRLVSEARVDSRIWETLNTATSVDSHLPTVTCLALLTFLAVINGAYPI